MFINPGGLLQFKQNAGGALHTRWFVPSGINMNAFGIAQKVGKEGALGMGLCSVGFGDILWRQQKILRNRCHTARPFNVSVDTYTILQIKWWRYNWKGFWNNSGRFRIWIWDRRRSAVFGREENQFKLGIALRNIGVQWDIMVKAVATQLQSISGHNLTYDVRINRFELPSLLHIGTSYDLNYGDDFCHWW